MKTLTLKTCWIAALTLVVTAFWLVFSNNDKQSITPQPSDRGAMGSLNNNAPQQYLGPQPQHSSLPSTSIVTSPNYSTNIELDAEARNSTPYLPEEQVINIGEQMEVEDRLDEPMLPAGYYQVKNMGADLDPSTVYE